LTEKNPPARRAFSPAAGTGYGLQAKGLPEAFGF